MMNFLKKLNKVIPFIMIFAGVALFAADPLSPNTENLIKGGIKETQYAGGGFFYIVNAYLPLILIFGGAAYGILSALANKQDNESASKMITRGLAGGTYGYFGAIFIWAIVGLILAGNPVKGPVITYHYWDSAMKAVAGDDVFTQTNQN